MPGHERSYQPQEGQEPGRVRVTDCAEIQQHPPEKGVHRACILFFVLYYPTQTYIEQQWKLEVIEGNAFSLRATDSFIFELPADKSDNEYKKVIEKISQVIAARS